MRLCQLLPAGTCCHASAFPLKEESVGTSLNMAPMNSLCSEDMQDFMPNIYSVLKKQNPVFSLECLMQLKSYTQQQLLKLLWFIKFTWLYSLCKTYLYINNLLKMVSLLCLHLVDYFSFLFFLFFLFLATHKQQCSGDTHLKQHHFSISIRKAIISVYFGGCQLAIVYFLKAL